MLFAEELGDRAARLMRAGSDHMFEERLVGRVHILPPERSSGRHGKSPRHRASLSGGQCRVQKAGARGPDAFRRDGLFLAPVLGLERGTGFEPATTCLEGRGSAGMSYPRACTLAI